MNTKRNEIKLQKQIYKYLGILFFINPFITFLLSFAQNKNVARNVLWAFIAFYSLTFQVPGEGSDAATHIREYKELANEENFSFVQFVKSLYNEEADVLIPLLKYSLSRVSSSDRLLLLSIGLIFGFFFSRNIFLLITHAKQKISFPALVLFFTLCVLFGPWTINAFRYPIAFHIFIYGVLMLLTTGQKKYYLYFFLAPLAHFSIVIGLALFFAYKLFGGKLVLLSFFFLSSFIFRQAFNTGDFKDLMPKTNIESIENREKSYLNENYIELRGELADATNWYVTGRRIALTYAIITIVFLLIWKRSKMRLSELELNLLCFGLFIMANINFLKDSVGSIGRIGIIGEMLFLSGIFIYLTSRDIKLPNLLTIPLTVCFALYVIVEVRIGIYTFTPDLFLSNPVLALYKQTGWSLDNILRELK